MTGRWQSYDSAAVVYDRIAEPVYFSGPAHDLVASAGLSPGDLVLDLGVGTGAVARRAMAAVRPSGRVIGLDVSRGMLEVARHRGVQCVVAANVDLLPHRGDEFDCVLAGFVLAHMPSYECSLTEAARVLRPGGRLGVTSWETTDDPYRRFWRSVASSIVDIETLEQATARAIPWEARFAHQANLREALTSAGLTRLTTHRCEYDMEISIRDFLALREESMQGRYLKAHTSAEGWQEFCQGVEVAFRERFRDPLVDARTVHVAIGTK